MFKIKNDVDLKELEKYGFVYWDKPNAKIKSFKIFSEFHIVITDDRKIDLDLPIGSELKKEDIDIESLIKDLIDGDFAEEIDG